MKTTAQHIPRTRSDRRAQTRKALLDATIAVLQTTGLDGCSLANVAKYAGRITVIGSASFQSQSAVDVGSSFGLFIAHEAT